MSLAVCLAWPPQCLRNRSTEKNPGASHLRQLSVFRPLFDRALQQTLNRNGFEDAEVYVETLESNRFPGNKHAALFRYYLGQKYAKRKIDLVITVWDRALNYALEHRQRAVSQRAYVSPSCTRPRTFRTRHPNRAGHGRQSFPRHRQARAEACTRTRAGSPSSTDRSKATTTCRRRLRDQLEPIRAAGRRLSTCEISRCVNLLERVKALPDDSLILYRPPDAENPHTADDAESKRWSKSSARRASPSTSPRNQLVGQGVVGGVVFKNDAMAELAADTAIRIMSGTPAREISVRESPTLPMFDWRQLRRWGIQLDQLPAESDVRFREYTFWEQNRRYVAGALAVFLIQSCLIAGLLIQRARRRRAEGALRANEQALQVEPGRYAQAGGPHHRRTGSRACAHRARAARRYQPESRAAGDGHPSDLRSATRPACADERTSWRNAPPRSPRTSTISRTSFIPRSSRFSGSCRRPSFSAGISPRAIKLDIDFVHDRMPSNVPPDPALCLFRIVQEALQNVVKHSGARTRACQADRHARIAAARDCRIRAMASTRQKLGGGMGLLSMRERVNFLDGHMTIWSKPGAGHASCRSECPLRQPTRRRDTRPRESRKRDDPERIHEVGTTKRCPFSASSSAGFSSVSIVDFTT